MTNLEPAVVRTAPNLPHFTLKKDRHVSKIQIGHWTIAATKRPILNGKEIDATEKSLNLPLPEMTFGNNSLTLSYDPSSEASSSSSTTIPPPAVFPHSSGPIRSPYDERSSSSRTPLPLLCFSTAEALAGVATGEGWEQRVGGGVKVSMADTWSKSRTTPSLLSDQPLPSKPVKPHDWTYSTCYAGSSSSSSAFQHSTNHEIPMDLLSRRDPVLDQILFYEDVPLFEDELHDNGESILNVRIRVMPHAFFILLRLFVRVDNVLFRIHDVRIYHSLGSDQVLREVTGMEADYEQVRQRLKKPSDLSPLTDPNWVSEIMTSLSNWQPDGSRPPLTSRDTGKPWPGLGKCVEMLSLSDMEVDHTEAARDGIAELKM